MRIPSLFITLVILFYSNLLFSQGQDTLSLNALISKTEVFAEKYPQEKMHLHFDKPYYALGDTIWFKAYLTTGLHFPSPISKVLYVDITNKQDSLVQSLKLPVTNGIAWGNIALDAQKYQQGNYRIRSYTRWMMNFEPDYFFSKNIVVGHSDKKVSTHISFLKSGQNTIASIVYKSTEGMLYDNKKVSWSINGNGNQVLKGKSTTNMDGKLTLTIPPNGDLKNLTLNTVIEINEKPVSNAFALPSGDAIDLQFFPEGGDLVAGMPSKVAFKTLNADGWGINIKGNIVDNEAKVVSTFESVHLGMGSFILLPEDGKTYKAIIATAGSNKQYSLPEVKTSGIGLMVKATGADTVITARILCNEKFLATNQNKSFYITAKVDETIYYAAQAKLQSQALTLNIPKSKFPTGIVQITVFSSGGVPQTERLVFVNQSDMLDLTLKTDKSTYGRRQKVKLSIASKSNKIPVGAHLSVSVTDEAKVPYSENDEVTILSNLLLTANLKGFIEKPNYYFNRPNEKTAANLDLLLLTQGYRRFLYKDILAGKQPEIFLLPEQGIEISGMLRNSTGMPLNKANVRLRVPSKYFSAYAVTNGSGIFKFPDVAFTDSSEVIINSADYSIKNPILTVNPISLQPQYAKLPWPLETNNIDSVMNPYLQNNNRIIKNSTLLKEVIIKSKAKTNVPSHRDHPALSSLSIMPDHLINKERFAGCGNFFSCMRGMLTGVTFDNQNFYVSRAFNAGDRTPMQIFFNGMPVDVSYLSAISTESVESVEIFLKDDIGSVNKMYAANGALVINSKKVEKSNITLDQVRNMLPKAGEIKFKPQGYAASREFYSPRYVITPQTQFTGNDFRSTIYWNPNIKTDKTSGNTLAEFFNADGKGSYRVIVEGIDNDGYIGRAVYRYKVE